MELNVSESIARPDNSRLFYSAVASGKYDMFAKADETILDAPGIYCIFSSESNMLYIGCSINIKKRIKAHKSHLSSGVHVCRLMSDDYERSPESFRFFPITYIDESNFTLPESIRNHLFYLENQHMKRVPLAVLYNSLMPASLSEKMLLSEQPKRPQGIPITEIINRLGMSVDSIKSNGFSASDILPHEKAVEFLQKRTVANGRFPEEKAAIAREFLAELQALSPSKNDESEGFLMRGGVMDYFDKVNDFQQKIEDTAKFKNAIKWAEMKATHIEKVRKEEPKIDKLKKWPLWMLFVLTAGASVSSMFYVSASFNGGGIAAIFLTMTFASTPLLLVYAGVKDFMGWVIIIGNMLVVAFCNSIAIFGALTNLGHSYILSPTVFLEAVTNFANTDYMTTARAVSMLMALVVSGIELAAFKNLSKRD